MTSELIMAVRDQEAEPILVEVDDGEATLTLDDGARLVFDAGELRAALGLTAVAHG